MTGAAFVVFAETGLMVGFFLPGDSLLVTAGLFAAHGDLDIAWLNVVLCAAAVIGATPRDTGSAVAPARRSTVAPTPFSSAAST